MTKKHYVRRRRTGKQMGKAITKKMIPVPSHLAQKVAAYRDHLIAEEASEATPEHD